MQREGHLHVRNSQDMGEAFDQGYFQSSVVQLFCQFQSDVASTNHESTANAIFRYRRQDGIHISHIPESEDSLMLGTRDGESDRVCAWAQDQCVIGLSEFLASHEI